MQNRYCMPSRFHLRLPSIARALASLLQDFRDCFHVGLGFLAQTFSMGSSGVTTLSVSLNGSSGTSKGLKALKNIHGRSFGEGLHFFWLQSASKAGAWCFRPEEDRPEFSIFCSLASRCVIFWGWTFKDCGRTSTVHSGHHFWLVFYFHRRRHLSVARLSPVSQAEPR